MCDIQNIVFQDSTYDNFIGFLLKSAVLGNPKQKAIFNMTCSSSQPTLSFVVLVSQEKLQKNNFLIYSGCVPQRRKKTKTKPITVHPFIP